MRILKVFFYGTGHWSQKYLENIISKFSGKIEILTIITNNNKFKHSFFNVEFSLNEALKKYNIPDGFIICTNPKNNISILENIIKFNKPILIEKPIFLPYQKNLASIDILSKNYPLKNIVVNHSHFFHKRFLDIFYKLRKYKSYNLKIIDGNFGPYRNFSPIIDWGPHSLGIVSFFLNNKDEYSIIKVRKVNYVDQYKFNTYINISSNDKKRTFRILLGNNFKNKKRIISFKNKYIEKKFDLLDSKNKKVNTLHNLLDYFYKQSLSKSQHTFFDTYSIALFSTRMIKHLLNKL